MSNPASLDRWEQLKPVIEHLYMTNRMSVAEVAATMKKDHRFDAGENQYKYHFKKWKWKRNIAKQKKDRIASRLQKRAAAGKTASSIIIQGRAVPPHIVRRHLKETSRQSLRDMVPDGNPHPVPNDGQNIARSTPLFANGTFLKWNMPILRLTHPRIYNHASPMEISAATPDSDIVIATPPALGSSPNNVPSPTTGLVKQKTTVDRAHLFVRGQHDKLLKSMNKEEKLIMSDWLYQYWFFCFKTAKNWGRGPRWWTSDSLQFKDFTLNAPRSLPGTPGEMPDSRQQKTAVKPPTNLCRWFIHLSSNSQERYEEILEVDTENTPDNQDPLDESTWCPWPGKWSKQPLHSTLRDALEHNDFSSFNAQDLPVAIPQVAKALKLSPEELLLESLGFSIMSRNVDQVYEIARRLEKSKVNPTPLYPYHLAASHLDGFKSCCLIVQKLFRLTKFREAYINELGHTVLDSIMIKILQSHSSIQPEDLDSTLRTMNRFPGAEVDICGRWDADSDCVRQLYLQGNNIPSSWKHKFCHTSIQAVCHFLTSLIDQDPFHTRETPSGLYERQCFGCGLKLQLSPLHSLVVTTFHLACYGFKDEDLFGMIACLLLFVSSGVEPQKMNQISIQLLLGETELETSCDHEELSAADLAGKLTNTPLIPQLGIQIQTGWEVFCRVLHICQNNFRLSDSDHDSDDDSDDDIQDACEDSNGYLIGEDHSNGLLEEVHVQDHLESRPFGGRRDIASLWASIQAEFLTYRRLNEDCPWNSKYFSLHEVLDSLRSEEPISTGYTREDLLQTHCICGSFASPINRPTLHDATKRYIANLDVWQRATYHMNDE